MYNAVHTHISTFVYNAPTVVPNVECVCLVCAYVRVLYIHIFEIKY